LHLSLLVLQRQSRGDAQRRQRDIQRHREAVLRESERKHIESDAGADTETMTKMRKRKNKMKEKHMQSRPTRGSEGPEEGDSRIGSKR
jgi:hypothetical protein